MNLSVKKNIFIIGEIDSGSSTLAKALNGKYFREGAKTNDPYSLNDFSNNIICHNTHNLDKLDTVEKNENVICLLVVNCKENIERQLDNLHSKTSEKLINYLTKFLIFNKIDYSYPNINYNNLKKRLNIKSIHKTNCLDGIGIQDLRDKINQEYKSLEKLKEKTQIDIIVETMSKSLCKLIAKDPNSLNKLEWRDIERVIAFSLEGLGFSIILTPPSKDGGKDIIASCIVENEELTYFIEIKHWIKKGKVSYLDIESFIELNLKENTSGGLFLSTSGFTNDVYKSISSVSKQKVRIGDNSKIITLCQRYVKYEQSDIWHSQSALPELLFENSI